MRSVVVAAGVALVAGVVAYGAEATNKVYSPYVHKGEWEVEARYGYDIDDRDSKDGKFKQKYAVGYGVTDFWATEVYGILEKPADEESGTELKEWEWANLFSLAPKDAWWVDMGLYLAYVWADDRNSHDELEAKLLFRKNMGAFDHTLNLNLYKELRNDPQDELDYGLAWRSRYTIHDQVKLGVEWYSNFGPMGEGYTWDEQTHQFGPVVDVELFEHVELNIGYLVGVSDAAADGTLKALVEFEF